MLHKVGDERSRHTGHRNGNIQRSARQFEAEFRLTVGFSQHESASSDIGDVLVELEGDHPGYVDHLAGIEDGGDDELHIVERMTQVDAFGAGRQFGDLLPGRKLLSQRFFLVRPDALDDRRLGDVGSRRDASRIERGADFTCCHVDQTHFPIESRGRQCLSVGMEIDCEDAGRHVDQGVPLQTSSAIFLQLLLFLRTSRRHHLGHDLFEFVGQRRVELIAVDGDLTSAVPATGRRDALAVLRDGDGEDASFQRRQPPNEVGIVADTSRCFAEDAVDFGDAVGAADDDLVARGMPSNRLDASLECSRCDRGDVIDKTLGRHLDQLGGHVSADRHKMLAVYGKDGIEHPVVVGSLKQDLLAACRVEDTHRVVGATDNNQLAVGRPFAGVDRVVRDGDRKCQLSREHGFAIGGALLQLPDLQLAGPSGESAGDGKTFSIRRERHRFDPFGQADQAPGQSSFGSVQEDLMEPGDSQPLAIGTVVERRDDRWAHVDGRMIEIVTHLGVLRRIIDGALANPLHDLCDRLGIQRRSTFGHRRFAVDRRDHFDEVTLFGFAGHDGRRSRFSSPHQPLELRHDIVAIGLGRLVAPLAVGLENGPNFAVKADRSLGSILRFISLAAGRDDQRPRGHSQPQQRRTENTSAGQQSHRMGTPTHQGSKRRDS